MSSRTVAVPGEDDDILHYIAELFSLEPGDFPTNCVVIFEWLPGDGFEKEDLPGAWSVRTGGDARYSSEIGLVQMAAHQLMHDSLIIEDD